MWDTILADIVDKTFYVLNEIPISIPRDISYRVSCKCVLQQFGNRLPLNVYITRTTCVLTFKRQCQSIIHQEHIWTPDLLDRKDEREYESVENEILAKSVRVRSQKERKKARTEEMRQMETESGWKQRYLLRAVWASALLLRIVSILLGAPSLIGHRVEIATPTTSIKRCEFS